MGALFGRAPLVLVLPLTALLLQLPSAVLLQLLVHAQLLLHLPAGGRLVQVQVRLQAEPLKITER